MVVPAIANNLTSELLYSRLLVSHCIYPSPTTPQKLPIYPKPIMNSRHTGNLSVGKSKFFPSDELVLTRQLDGIHVDMEHLKKGEVK